MCLTVHQNGGQATCINPVTKWGDSYACYCKTTWREGNVHNSRVKMMRGQCVLLLWQNEEGKIQLKWNDNHSVVMVTVEQECEKWRETQDATQKSGFTTGLLCFCKSLLCGTKNLHINDKYLRWIYVRKTNKFRAFPHSFVPFKLPSTCFEQINVHHQEVISVHAAYSILQCICEVRLWFQSHRFSG